MNDTEGNALNPFIQLRNDTKDLRRSILFFQIAIGINILSVLIFNLIGHISIYIPKSDLFLKAIELSTFIHLVTSLAPFGLILLGLYRIICLLRYEIHFFYSISAIALFAFGFLLKAEKLWHYILISTGRGFSESGWAVYGLAILPPLGIISCYVIGIRLNFHFSSFMSHKKTIQWLVISFAVFWFLRIALAFVLWLQSSQTIEFSLRYLVHYSYRWQLETKFYWRYIRHLILGFLLWQVWLFFCLRSIKLKCQKYLEAENLIED